MSYSDDTISFMAWGTPTMSELVLDHNDPIEPLKRRTIMCESCEQRPATGEARFGDGTSFMLCDECRPFDPSGVKVVLHRDDDDQIPPSC